MFRNLILIVAIAAIIWIVRGFIRRAQITQKTTPKLSKDMVQCEQCRTYLPKDEAITETGKFFCCKQHLIEWKQNL